MANEKLRHTKYLSIIRLILLIMIGIPENGQCQRALSIGKTERGLALGNPNVYNGVKLNFFDNKQSEKHNGFAFSLLNNTPSLPPDCIGW